MSSSDSGDNRPTATPISPLSEDLPDQPLKGLEGSIDASLALPDKTGGVLQTEVEISPLGPTTSPPSEEQVPHQSDKEHHDKDENGQELADDDTPTLDQAEISKHDHDDAESLWATTKEGSDQPIVDNAAAGAEAKPFAQPEEDDNGNNLVWSLFSDDSASHSSFFCDEPVATPAPVQDAGSGEDDGMDKINPLLFVRSPRKTRRRSKRRRKLAEESEIPSREALELLYQPEDSTAAWGPPWMPGNSMDYQNTSKKEDDSDDGQSNHNPFAAKGAPGQAMPDEGYLDPPPVSQEMSAKDMWERMKQRGDRSDALDRLMALVGLQSVKIQFLKIKTTIEAARRRKGWLRRLDLNMALLGNPGTGKTTVAKIYHDFLIESKVWPESGSANIITFDDVDQEESTSGRFFRSESNAERYLSRVRGRTNDNEVIIVTGSVIGVSKILGSRPHSRWECWRRVRLPDYDDEHLQLILLRLIERNNLQVDGGPESPYPLMLAKRISRGRNTDGFGNVHEIALAFEQTLERQAYRLKQTQLIPTRVHDGPITNVPNEREANPTKTNNPKRVLTMADLMGPEPAELWAESTAWKELDRMAGLEDVKKAVRSLMRRSKTNYRRELQGKEPLQMSLNRLFLGPPGTGKTTVAKLYAQILGELDLLSSKEVIFTTPSDFIGPYTGQTETRTSSIIESAAGKALIIDDAHTFFTRDETSFLGDDLDSFRRACIDTLVSRIHNRPGEDRSVILIGYADKMEEMFRKCNPGLKRRFPLEEAFRFYDYDDSQLNEILRIKMAKEDITASKKAMDVAAEVLRRARDRPNFGNGGDIDNLLNQAKARFRERKAAEKEKQKVVGAKRDEGNDQTTFDDEQEEDEDDRTDIITLQPQDFDPDWDRGTNSNSTHTSSLFSDLLGFDDIRKQFEGYQLMASNMRLRGKDPRESIPFTYVFAGPPGTGKTHTARIMGKMFYRMGFLSTDEVVECSASHMVGQYAGQTAPKVVSLLDSALGKVLFIDEAYRLASSRRGGGGFESEAIGELVDCMTKPRYLRKMIIILAGYNKDMSLLLKSNAGLRGRFPTEIRFKPMGEELSRDHLMKLLAKQDITIYDEKKPSSEDHETVLRLFYKLGMTEGWSNGRDIQSLANVITAEVYKSTSLADVLDGDGEGEAGAGGKETKTGAGADENVLGLGDLHISTRMLIKFLKDLLRERIKAAGSGDKSDNPYSGVAQ